MLVKLSRGGKFLSCSRYPECDGALSIDGVEIKKDEPIGTDPVSGFKIFVKTFINQSFNFIALTKLVRTKNVTIIMNITIAYNYSN